MGQKIVWSEEAFLDLKNIREYIARDSEMIAASFVERLLTAIERLEDFPQIGARIREWKSSAYRHLIVTPYRIIYRVDRAEGRVFLIAIVHGSRDLKRFLRSRR